jgi:transposase
MITQDQWGAIQTLWTQGHGKKAIARMLGLHVQTVRRQLERSCWKPYRRSRARLSILEPYRPYLIQRMPQVLYNAMILLQELRGLGYGGGYEVVKRFVKPHRDERCRLEEATLRFETAPGRQAQVDWGTAAVSVGGVIMRVQFFVMVLGYSRRIFATATADQKVRTLLTCHEAAFEHFGGRTLEVLYDNPKTVCLRREEGRVVYNPVFEDFARHWGYTTRLCQYYRAQTKGKVESGVKYVKGNFLPGRTFESMEHLNRELSRWCVEVADRRVHGTTHRVPAEAFAEEKLVATQGHPPYVLVDALRRTVAKDCLVTYQTNRYSVPARHVGKTVDLVANGGELRVFLEGEAIARHRLVEGRFQVVSEREHYAELFQRRAKALPTPPLVAPWPDVEVRPLAVYEQLAWSGGAR